MNLEELKTLVQNKINKLVESRNSAYTDGDIASYEEYKKQIEEAQIILDKLNS